MSKFTAIAISKLEKKVYECYASVTEQPFSMENKEERRLLYPKFGEKTNPGVFMYLNEHDELCFSSQTKGKSLPELMLRNPKTKRKIDERKGKGIGGRWYPNPYPIFGDDLSSKKREPKDIDQHQVDIFLTFAGYENGYEDLSKFMEEFPEINTLEQPTIQSKSLFRVFLKKWKGEFFTALATMLLCLMMCWFKSSPSVPPCLEIVNNDPLKIVGTWNYEVTPSGNNAKMYGYANKEKTELALLNDKLIGYVNILPIPKGDSEYEMTGYRTAIIRNDSNLLLNKPPMRLQFFQVFPNIKKETYSFKFEITGEENSDGFVILDNLKGLKSKPRAMGGKIYYLYKNNEWHLAEIEFTEKNKE